MKTPVPDKKEKRLDKSQPGEIPRWQQLFDGHKVNLKKKDKWREE